MKHFINFSDHTAKDLLDLIDLASHLKKLRKQGLATPLIKGKTIGLIFNKPSTRTRVSFEAGINQLGAYGLYLSGQDLQLGHGESIHDTAKVLSRYVDCLMIRTFKQEDIEALVQYGSIPVINGLSDLLHPCQVLADLLTIKEVHSSFEGLKIAYVGDGNNMTNSWLQAASMLGIDISIATPINYKADSVIFNEAVKTAQTQDSRVHWTTNPIEAVTDADIVYTDTWVSMGSENEKQERLLVFKPYQVNQALMQHAKKDCIFLHCLPAYRGQEVTTDVIDGPQSYVFDQAENRLHVQKAVMLKLLAEPSDLRYL